MNLKKLLQNISKLAYFKEPTAIDMTHIPGDVRMVVGVGENASGKSFFRRLVQGMCQRDEVECIAVSVEGRCYSSPMRPFIYGSEEWQSTGENSVNTVLAGISTSKSRDKDHVIFWDEPDLGLSEGWAAGVGQKMAEYGAALPEKAIGAFVITHSRALVRQLVPLNPHFIYFGKEPPASLQAWVDQPIVPLAPETLPEISHKRFLQITKIVKGNRP